MPNMNACLWCYYYKGNHCHVVPLHPKAVDPINVCDNFKFKLQSVKVDKLDE